jgi:prophage regulatory protein
MSTNPPHIFVDREKAAELAFVSVRTWESLVAAGEAPKPRKVSKQLVRWLYREVIEWAESRPVSDHQPGPGRRESQGDQQGA